MIKFSNHLISHNVIKIGVMDKTMTIIIKIIINATLDLPAIGIGNNAAIIFGKMLVKLLLLKDLKI